MCNKLLIGVITQSSMGVNYSQYKCVLESLSTMSTSFSVDSAIRGHHIYKEIWTPFLGEILSYKVEPGNIHDPYATAVKRSCDNITVGHVPRIW